MAINSYGSKMADDTRKVRIEEQLKVKIGEAKNLVGRNNSNGGAAGCRDVYCTVALDQEEICRTPTIERTLSPFFGEEYQFEIPRRFRYLSIYVWDRDRHLKQDKPIGKIAIRREELHIYNHKDHWFSLRPVDADSEVQGMAHVQIQFEEVAGQQQQQQLLLSNTGYLKRKSDYDERLTLNRNNLVAVEKGYCSNNMLASSSLHHDHKENNENLLQKPTISSSSSSSVGITSTLGKTRHLFGTTDLSIWNSSSSSSVSSSSSHHTTTNTIKKPSQSNVNYHIDLLHPFRNEASSTTASGRVAIRVIECVDLAKKNGCCDPYVMFTATYSNKRKIIKRTKVRKKTINPQFDEVLYFDLTVDSSSNSDSSKHESNNTYTIHPLGGADLCEICISVWHDAPGMGTDKVFLGEIKIPMRGKQQQTALQSNAWYFLQPRTSQSRPARSCATPPGTRLSCDNSLGSLRLKLVYTADHVFPLATYDALMNLLLKSLEQKPITSSAVYILGEIVSCKTDIAQPLVRFFTHTNSIASIIKLLADHEISNLTDPTTIFRGNTLVSKMMDEAMRLSGLHYLHKTLRPVLDSILHEKKPCEIDPARVKDKSVIDTNLLNLQDYVEKVFDAITKSAVRCPSVLCQIFHDLRECAAKHFPSNKEVRYSVVSGFIFLRFFAPAILGPKLFDLTTEPLDPQTNRTLTLISKTIQSLGNLVSSRSAQQPCKEEYTGQLYKKFCTEKHVEAVKHFLEVISTVGANNNDETILEPVLLKEGMMTKRAQGRKRFGRRNFKQRYFRLTTHSLSYAKSKGKRPICDIPLSEILAVERLNEGSFKMQNIFQIIRKDRPLYVQTTNCVEEKEWVDLLSKICQSNKAKLQNFHPCAFVNGMWNCCGQNDENAPGCKQVSNKPFQMELATALDPARDLQRLHTLIMSHLPRLEELFSSTASTPVQTTSTTSSTASTLCNNFEDLVSCRMTVHVLTEIAYNLEQVHRTYKQILARELKYGSRQAPIGDDNYLHMIRSGLGGATSVNPNGTSLLSLPSSSSNSLLSQQQQQQKHNQQNYELSPICFSTRHDVLRNVANSDKLTTSC